jgi:hypothetical protein
MSSDIAAGIPFKDLGGFVVRYINRIITPRLVRVQIYDERFYIAK